VQEGERRDGCGAAGMLAVAVVAAAAAAAAVTVEIARFASPVSAKDAR